MGEKRSVPLKGRVRRRRLIQHSPLPPLATLDAGAAAFLAPFLATLGAGAAFFLEMASTRRDIVVVMAVCFLGVEG